MLLSVYQLLDVCDADKLALHAANYNEFYQSVSTALNRFRAEQKDQTLYYVTTNARFQTSVSPNAVCWLFMLLNPKHRFLSKLDARKSALLERARLLNPDDYVYGTGYHYDRVAEKLGCTRMEGIYITECWEILPVYSDRSRGIIDIDYLLRKNRTVEGAEKTYMVYAGCTEEQAERVIQKHLSVQTQALTALYPGGKIELRDGERVFEVLLLSRTDKEKKEKWQALPHPIFRAHSKSPETASAMFYDYLAVSLYRYALYTAFLYLDRHIEYQGSGTKGTEKEDVIRFVRTEHISYHDGGGGSRDSLQISAIPEAELASVKMPDQLMTNSYYRGISIPPCQGYWDEDGVIFLKEPFAMDGVFTIEETSESWD